MTCRAVLSIGGNRGDTLGLLRGVAESAAADGILQAVSAVYATPPWGGVEQDDFLNAVLVVEHPGTPSDVLEWGFARERAAGRTRDVRWGPRTLDVDVVNAMIARRPRNIPCETVPSSRSWPSAQPHAS